MRGINRYIALVTGICLFTWFACTDESESLNNSGEKNRIALGLLLQGNELSRVTTPGEGRENFVGSLDVFLYEEGMDDCGYYERIELTGEEKQIYLKKYRHEFNEGKKYVTYVIANAQRGLGEMKLSELKETINNETLPEFGDEEASFLMDGVSLEMEVNPGGEELADILVIPVELKRAVAKVRVTINGSENYIVKMVTGWLVNRASCTRVIAGGRVPDDKQLSRSDEISRGLDPITLYAYEHAWENEMTMDNETYLVVKVPVERSDNRELVENNYYKIHLNSSVEGQRRLDRNCLYNVTATVNALGSEQEEQPKELEATVSAMSWEEGHIYVGEEHPLFLVLNTDGYRISNQSEDHTIHFFSSSKITNVEITNVTYIDKFGQTKPVPESIKGQMSAKPDETLDGNIKITSPIPTNNTPRYFTLIVTNADGLKQEVKIEQYPLEYITSTQGYCSYRDDFGGTTADRRGDNGITQITFSTGGSFNSKVARNNADGTSVIYDYSWQGNGMRAHSENGSLNNARMYRVIISKTSDHSVLGIPRLDDNGYTEASLENDKVVSPSFMLASQLGGIRHGGFYGNQAITYEEAKEHCAQYVEVTKVKGSNGKERYIVFDDWRLPTEAELKIIAEYQGKTDAAIDMVLKGNWYWGARGAVWIGGGTRVSESYASIRCIRDAYDHEDELKEYHTQNPNIPTR